MASRKSKRVARGFGDNCQVCSKPMIRYEHGSNFKPKEGSTYYLWWFVCKDKSCKTQVMPPEAHVRPTK